MFVLWPGEECYVGPVAREGFYVDPVAWCEMLCRSCGQGRGVMLVLYGHGEDVMLALYPGERYYVCLVAIEGCYVGPVASEGLACWSHD